MNRALLVASSVAACLILIAAASPAEEARVVVSAMDEPEESVDPHSRVSFGPRPEPYFAGGPSVSIPVPDGITLADSGERVCDCEFIGWHREEGVRVQAFAMVPSDEDSPCVRGIDARDRLSRREIAGYDLAFGETLKPDDLSGTCGRTVKIELDHSETK